MRLACFFHEFFSVSRPKIYLLVGFVANFCVQAVTWSMFWEQVCGGPDDLISSPSVLTGPTSHIENLSEWYKSLGLSYRSSLMHLVSIIVQVTGRRRPLEDFHMIPSLRCITILEEIWRVFFCSFLELKTICFLYFSLFFVKRMHLGKTKV